MMDWSKWASEPDDNNRNEYPTIIDIIEDIIREEDSRVSDKYPLLHNYTPLSLLERSGHYIIMSPTGDNNNLELLPVGKSRMTYYRGQSKYHSSCKSSLYRDKNNVSWNELVSSLQIAELYCCLRKHPVIWDIMQTRLNFQNKIFNVPIPIHFEGLAQHYGIMTSCLDITADKWVAAFFATTVNENGTYKPVDTNIDGHPKHGVFYRYPWMMPDGSIRKGEVHAIGQQYFNRPGRQSALVINLNENDDFNTMEGVEKIFFRHDNNATKLIYDLSQQGRRFFPQDSLASIINKFVKGMAFSKEAVLTCNETDFPFVSHDAFIQWVKDNKLTIMDEPQLVFDPKEVQKEYDYWIKEGKQRFLNQIHALPVLKLPA